VLEYNAHLQQNHITKPDGTKAYHCKYRKQTKKWDITPEKYEYMSEIMECVYVMRIHLCHKGVMSVNQPARQQSNMLQRPLMNWFQVNVHSFININDLISRVRDMSQVNVILLETEVNIRNWIPPTDCPHDTGWDDSPVSPS